MRSWISDTTRYSSHSYRLLVWLGLLICLCNHAPVRAEIRVEIALSENTAVYRAVAEQLQQDLQTVPNLSLSIVTLDAPRRANLPQLSIAVGTQAAAALGQRTEPTPILCIFLTRTAYETIHFAAGVEHSAIYMDQPLARWLVLASKLLPPRGTVAITTAPNSAYPTEQLQKQAQRLGIQVKLKTLPEDANPLSILDPLFQQSDAFLALPDQAAFNRSTAKWILYLSFKYKKPVIGFSKKFTEAGAAVSLFADTKDSSWDASQAVLAWLQNDMRMLPAAAYGRAFSVEVNEVIVQTLGLTRLADAVQLHDAVQREEVAYE